MPGLVAELVDGGEARGAADVVDPDVEPAEALGGEVGQGLDVRLTVGVAGVEDRLVPGVQLLQRLLALEFAAAADDDRRAVGQEGLGDGAADTACAARDHRDTSVEAARSHHVVLLRGLSVRHLAALLSRCP